MACLRRLLTGQGSMECIYPQGGVLSPLLRLLEDTKLIVDDLGVIIIGKFTHTVCGRLKAIPQIIQLMPSEPLRDER